MPELKFRCLYQHTKGKIFFLHGTATNENKEEVVAWWKEVTKGHDERTYSIGANYGMCEVAPEAKYLNEGEDTFPKPWIGNQITTEQFRQYVLRHEEKHIGYILKPECEKYREAALKIIGATALHDLVYKSYHFSKNSEGARNLKEAGVLDLWFNRAYKLEYKIITMGTSIFSLPLMNAFSASSLVK